MSSIVHLAVYRTHWQCWRFGDPLTEPVAFLGLALFDQGTQYRSYGRHVPYSNVEGWVAPSCYVTI